MRPLLFIAGVILVLVPEVLRVYYIMPFPGSQQDVPGDARHVDIAYWLHNNIWWLRLIGSALIVGPAIHYLRQGGWGRRIAVVLPIVLCVVVVYAFNFRFMADKMFLVQEQKVLRSLAEGDASSTELVLVVERAGDARAFPISIIGYHHQVMDTIGHEPVLITYCTVCRTGRAWSPKINDEADQFRLVGMDHFNAMFEDSRTKSWWRQVSGECIAGPLKGRQLDELFSSQMTLGEFARRHPSGMVLQPDPLFLAKYEALDGFDDGTIASSLEQRDATSWQRKSWVVGVLHNGAARAYDWNDLLALRTISDTLGGEAILVRLHPDNASFDVIREADQHMAIKPVSIPAYQEFWHSWRTFQSGTTRYQATQ
ncbi:MAG: DUF3179 domain-containing protein [Flavobacteriales bacterium]|nr:DUF3179 domain-containing protein [Flavobacteriales bacterium]